MISRLKPWSISIAKYAGSILLTPLQAEPGVKCKHCGAVLDFTEKHFAEKAALLLIAGNRDDVDLG